MNSYKQKKSRDLDAVRGASTEHDQGVHSVRRVERTVRGNKETRQRPRFIAGVDEAGRGPLAGPVAVGIAVVSVNFDWNLIKGVHDSKKVSPKNREAIFRTATSLKNKGQLTFSVSLVSAAVIDKVGITKAVRLGIDRAFKKLALNPQQTHVKLDGLLKAPPEFKNQETIIKGDQKEKSIGLASILAKVTRDRIMVRMANSYPQYKFEIHKGYGTKMHRAAIERLGLSKVHRRTFCRAFNR